MVAAGLLPLVFARPGTYSVPGGKQKTAFAQGTVYFRHGAKSEPGTTEDLAHALDRRLGTADSYWHRRPPEPPATRERYIRQY